MNETKINLDISLTDPNASQVSAILDALTLPRVIRPYKVTFPPFKFKKANGKQTKSDKARALFAAGERSLKVIMKKTGLGYHGVYAAVIRKKTKK